MRRLRWFRVLATVLLSVVAGCSAPAPPTPASAVTLYTLAESNRGKPEDIRHGKPIDIGWHAASGTFLVATYNTARRDPPRRPHATFVGEAVAADEDDAPVQPSPPTLPHAPVHAVGRVPLRLRLGE